MRDPATLPDFRLLFASSKPGSLYLQPTSPDIRSRPIIRGIETPRRPVQLERVQGARIGDLVSSAGNFRLISPAFQMMLQEEEFTGWSTYPFAVADEALAASLDGFIGLAVTGRAAPLDMTRATPGMSVPKTKFGLPTPIVRGLPLTGDVWDGSDLFVSEDWGYVFITPRVAQAIVRRKLKGVNIEIAAEHETYADEA